MIEALAGLARAAAVAVALAGASPARALDTNDAVRLALIGGGEVSGWFLRADGDGIIVVVDGVQTAVPLVLISAVEVDGAPCSLEAFRAEVSAAQVRQDALRDAPMPRPAPALTAGLSLLWAGGGHAALGQWREAGVLSAVDGLLLGTAAYAAFGTRDRGLLLTAAGLDIFFRVSAAADSARQARRRRSSARTGSM